MFNVGIRLFISLTLPFVLGYTLLNFIFRRSKLGLPTSLSLSYGLGMGILTQWMLLLGVAGIRYGVRIIGVPLAFASLFFALLVFKKRKAILPSSKLDQALAINNSIATSSSVGILRSVLYILLSTYVIYYVFYVFWRALNIPVYPFDAIASIAFKAKVLFFEESLINLKNIPPHPSYPIHVPLMQTWIALNLGTWNDQLIKIIFPFAFLSFIVIHNYFLTFYTNRYWSLLGTTLLVSSNLLILHATISYRELFLLYYNCTAIMLLLLWINKKDDAFLILASLFAGFATFTKLEGTAYLFIYTGLLLLILLHRNLSPFTKNLAKFLKFTIPSFGICLFFHFYKIFSGFPVEKTQSDFTWEHLSRIPIILKGFLGDIFLSGNWNIVWFLLVLSLVVNLTKLKSKLEVRLLFVALVMFFGLYFLSSLLTTNFIWISGGKSITTLSRLILHFFPLSTLLVVLLNYPEESPVSRSSLKPLKQARNK